jgi:hypothetical protein
MDKEGIPGRLMCPERPAHGGEGARNPFPSRLQVTGWSVPDIK